MFTLSYRPHIRVTPTRRALSRPLPWSARGRVHRRLRAAEDQEAAVAPPKAPPSPPLSPSPSPSSSQLDPSPSPTSSSSSHLDLESDSILEYDKFQPSIRFAGLEGPDSAKVQPDDAHIIDGTSDNGSSATILRSLDLTALATLEEEDPISASTLDLSPRTEKEKGGESARRYPLPPKPPVPFNEAILLQGFGWDSCKDGRGWWNVLNDQVQDFKETGFTHVWLPPPSKSVDKRGYLPSLLYDLDHSQYGNQEQLTRLTAALKAQGISPVCDIVINHRCADKQDHQGRWNTYGDYAGHPEGRTSVAWGPEAITGDEHKFGGRGNSDSGAGYDAAPDLDHENELVRLGILDWMRYLVEDIGFEGWRFDYVKGFGGQFTHQYIKGTLGEGVEQFSCGEFWTDLRWHGSHLDYNQDAACDALCRWVNRTAKLSAAFDFPLKGQLNEALKNTQLDRLRRPDGRPAGLLGWWPRRTITFVGNHDTDSTQQHWPMPSDKMEAAYAFILTHAGVPSVLHEHLYSWTDLGPKIRDLIRIRREAGITAVSPVKILEASHDLYVHEIEGANGRKVVLKLGPRMEMGHLKPRKEDGFSRVASGHWYAVWSNFNVGAREAVGAQGVVNGVASF